MKIGVLGGGFAGLACAHYLLRSGHRPVVLEASEHHGKLTRQVHHGEVELDAFADFLHATDTALLGLVADVGGLDRLVWRELAWTPRSGRGASLDPDPLWDSGLSRFERLRGGLGYLYLTHVLRYVAPLDRVSAVEWTTRVCGRAVADKLVRPLLAARYGDYADLVPAYTLWGALARARWRDRGVRGYIRGGYRWLADHLRASLESRGAEVRLESEVVGLEWEGGVVGVRLANSAESLEFPLVICTLRPSELAKLAGSTLIPDLPLEVPYHGAVSALLVSRAPLDEFLNVILTNPELPFQELIEATHLVPLEQTRGRHLLYLVRHCPPESEAYRLPEDVIAKQAREQLCDMYPSFDPGRIEAVHVSRAPALTPLWTVGALERKAPFRMGHTGVYLCSTAQAYPRPTSWDSCVMLAREVTSRIEADLG